MNTTAKCESTDAANASAIGVERTARVPALVRSAVVDEHPLLLDLFDDERNLVTYVPRSCSVPHVPSFDEWWDRYPRKQGKAKAIESWAKMSAPERAAAWSVLDDWHRYVRSVGTTRFVPYGSTFLNQKRWLDDAPPVENERTTAPGMSAVRRVLGR